MRIDLNLATRPFVNRTPHLLLIGGLAVLAGALCTWNVSLFLKSRAAQAAVEAQLGELKKEESALESRRTTAETLLAKTDLAPLAMRAQAANEVLAQKAVSWSLLLERLEQLLPWNAALRSVKTSVGPAGLRLDLEVRAKTYDDALQLIDSLEKSPCFSDVYPLHDLDPKPGATDFEMTVEAVHDPFCGAAPAGVSLRKGRSSLTRRGSHG